MNKYFHIVYMSLFLHQFFSFFFFFFSPINFSDSNKQDNLVKETLIPIDLLEKTSKKNFRL